MFTLRQSLSGFRYYQQLIREVDDEIESQMGELRSKAPEGTTVPERTKKAPYQRRHYEPATFDLRAELYWVFGVDLTDIPGIGAGTAQTILCELGTDISHFPNASAFASWLGLCPERRITGGKLLSTKTRRLCGRRSLYDRVHRPPRGQEREPIRGPGADPPGRPRTLRRHRQRRHTDGFLKGKSAVQIHRRLLHERRMTGLHFWPTGYCVSTVGLDEGRIRDYIREQEQLEAGQGDLDSSKRYRTGPEVAFPTCTAPSRGLPKPTPSGRGR